MNKLAVRTAIVIAACAAGWTGAGAQPGDEAGVRKALDHYLQGQATGKGEHYRQAFHPEAKLLFVRDGKLSQITSEEYVGRASGKPAADEARRKRSIESIDIAGDAAVAKIVLDYPEVKFTDYMTLLKVDGEWKIINKSFHAERREGASSR